jgi:hypothetical protein
MLLPPSSDPAWRQCGGDDMQSSGRVNPFACGRWCGRLGAFYRSCKAKKPDADRTRIGLQTSRLSERADEWPDPLSLQLIHRISMGRLAPSIAEPGTVTTGQRLGSIGSITDPRGRICRSLVGRWEPGPQEAELPVWEPGRRAKNAKLVDYLATNQSQSRSSEIGRQNRRRIPGGTNMRLCSFECSFQG